MTKINLYQNSYSKEIPVVNGLINYVHNNEAPLEREFPTYRKFYEEGIYKEADYTGILSPKFKEKTGMDGEDFKKLILDNPGYDVYFINPFISDFYLYYNIWTQGESCHPGLIELAQPLLSKLFNININRMPKSEKHNLLFCNFWVGNNKFWDDFIIFCEEVSKEMLRDNEKYFNLTDHYSKNDLPYYPFIMERLFSTFIYYNEYKVFGTQVDDTQSESLKVLRKNQISFSKSFIKMKESININPEFEKSIFHNFNNSEKLLPLNIDEIKNKSYQQTELLDLILDKALKNLKPQEYTIIKNDFLNYNYFILENKTIPNIFIYTYLIRPDLQNAFDLNSEEGKEGFYNWCINRGIFEILNRIVTIKINSDIQTVKYSKKDGFNLIGFSKTSLGLAEDLRNFQKLLDKMDIKNSVVNLNYHAQKLIPEGAEKQFIYKVNIFFLPLPDINRFFSEAMFILSPEFYNIGYSPWEFNKWSSRYDYHLDHVDELWGISDFTLEAYKEKNKKTLKINSLFDFKKLDQVKSNLNESFTFLFIFDSNSSIHRKNPMALIKSFKDAFQPNEDVKLVLKTIRLNKNIESKRILEEQIQGDERIKLIDDDMTQDELISLQASCHVYVSPHRCEGLGRTLVEAMYLEKPVIATNYSGIKDFCNKKTFLPVEYDLIPVEYYYLYTDDHFVWADVHIESLSRQLRVVFDDYKKIKILLSENKDFVKEKYSIESNIERYKDVFKSYLKDKTSTK